MGGNEDSLSAKMPVVSVGVPVFNGERFLAETLDALLEQTYDDLEIVICDNASTDGTPDICRAYAERDSRISFHRNEKNLGAAENYCRVFHLSRGRYFKWAAADDLCSPDMIERCVSVLDRDPGVVLCYARTSIISEDGTVLRHYDDNMHLDSPSAVARFAQLLQELKECNAIFGLIRYEVLKRTPLIGKYISSDSCLLGELCLHGRFHEIPERLFLRRDHPAASSSDRAIDKQLEFFDPALLDRIVLPFWRRRWENGKSVFRAPLRFHEKLALWRRIFRLVARQRVYRRELRYAARKCFRRVVLRRHPVAGRNAAGGGGKRGPA